MGSTNKTTNYNLSQFIGTDIPSWLSDYNGDMEKIDDAMKVIEDKADAGATDITGLIARMVSAETNIGNLQSNETSLANRVTVNESNIDTVHHEAVNNAQEIDDLKTWKDSVDADIDRFKIKVDETSGGFKPVYLSSSGDDTTGDGTNNKPFKTVAKVLELYGDVSHLTMYFKDAGVYEVPSVYNRFVTFSVRSNGITLEMNANTIQGYFEFVVGGGVTDCIVNLNNIVNYNMLNFTSNAFTVNVKAATTIINRFRCLGKLNIAASLTFTSLSESELTNTFELDGAGNLVMGGRVWWTSTNASANFTGIVRLESAIAAISNVVTANITNTYNSSMLTRY